MTPVAHQWRMFILDAGEWRLYFDWREGRAPAVIGIDTVKVEERELFTGPQWRPIETAPKDGSRLWLYWPTRSETDRQSVGWWNESIHGCWWMDPSDTESAGPTHWRELPAPPQKEG